ncbi:MAG: hypothetical protein ABJA02_09925 [Acidobacteriota bacterium]
MSEHDANSELKSLIETVLKTVNGLASDVRSNSYKLDGLEAKVDRIDTDLKALSSDVRVLSGQFNDVGVMAVKDNGRISDGEKRVDDLEAGVH